MVRELRAFGLAYPEAHTKSPWPGHLDLAVRDKTFAYLNLEGDPFHLTCKLPSSNAAALALPSTEPAGYGLGKSGWVQATFADDEMPPIAVLKEWIDESYRAVAPKKLSALIGTGQPTAAGAKGAGARGVVKKAGARRNAKTGTADAKAPRKGAAKRKGAVKRKATPKKRGR